MLAATPPMGWNTWNTFGPQIDAELIRQSAEAFLDHGLAQAGYSYVVIDDVWEGRERVDGRLVADADRFPGGITDLADDVHGKGLKLGIYSCAGTLTCEGELGSYGYEEVDAATFAEWGVDFLKYDFCHVPAGANGPELYRRMGQALRATGRDIVFSVCEWGSHQPWLWGAAVGAHMWRTTGDIVDTWESIVDIGFVRQVGLEPYAGPGRWNDPDMLVVGMYGKGNVGRGGCSDTEYRTHFSQWCLLAAPLMIGCDVRDMSLATKDILMNPEAIAVNQDARGIQARKIGEQVHADQVSQVWAKPLADGSVAAGLFNLGERSRAVGVGFGSVGISTPCIVRDLWARDDVGIFRGSYTTEVPAHGVAMIRLIPQ